MPVTAEFSEREYELAMNIELLAGGGAYSLPSQVAEKELGYDIALVPGCAAVWGKLGFARGLRGAAPGRGILSHPSAPTFAASLFLQYKRPEELRGPSAKETAPRKAAGTKRHLPYLRYELGRFQLSRLVHLHHEVGPLAEVCYAAAAFVSVDLLRELQLWQGVVASSNFLSLGQVDESLGPSAHDGSHVWTYGDHGNTDGVLCSEPLLLESYSGWSFLEGLARRLDEEPLELSEHLYELDQRVQAWSARHWGSTSRSPEWPLLLQMPGAMRAAASIERTARRRGLGWFLAYRL